MRVPLVTAPNASPSPELEAGTITLFAWSKARRGRFPWSKTEKPIGLGVVEFTLEPMKLDGRCVLWDPSGLLSLRLGLTDRDVLSSALAFLDRPSILDPEQLTRSAEFAYSSIRSARRDIELSGLPDPRLVRWALSEAVEDPGLPGGTLPPSLTQEKAASSYSALKEISVRSKRDVEILERHLSKLEALINSIRSLAESERAAISRAYAARISEAQLHLKGEEFEARRAQLEEEKSKKLQEIDAKYGQPIEALETLKRELESEVKSRSLLTTLTEEDFETCSQVKIPFGVVIFGERKKTRLELLPPSKLTEPGLGSKLKRLFGGRAVPLEPGGWGDALTSRVRELAQERTMVGSSLVTLTVRKNLLLKPDFVELASAGLIQIAEWGYIPEDWPGQALAVIVE